MSSEIGRLFDQIKDPVAYVENRMSELLRDAEDEGRRLERERGVEVHYHGDIAKFAMGIPDDFPIGRAMLISLEDAT